MNVNKDHQSFEDYKDISQLQSANRTDQLTITPLYLKIWHNTITNLFKSQKVHALYVLKKLKKIWIQCGRTEC